jgi:organic hydroperoxide reductase OsmC/OhrA
MHKYTATVAWERGDGVFAANRYSRAHEWRFDGGVTVPASSSPQVVPPPLSDVAAVDPEEALVASASSCHMLWFLLLASRQGFVVDSYTDEADGEMGPSASGKTAFTRITLRPKVVFSGAKLPTETDLANLHHHAHEECYIANSLTLEIGIEPG